MFTQRALLTTLVVLAAACANGAEDTTEVLGSVETTEQRQVVISTSEPPPTTTAPGDVVASTTSTIAALASTSSVPALVTTTGAARPTPTAPTATEPVLTDNGVELIPPAVVVATTTSTVRDRFVLLLDTNGFTSVEVTPGAAITFLNNDDVAQTVTSVTTDPADRFDSGRVEPASSATFIAPTTPGSYRFFSAEEPALSGFLTVSG